jgi:esterase
MSDRDISNAGLGLIPTPKHLPTGDAVNLYSQALGNGPPVILLHGLLGSANNLGALARQLGGYNTLRVDLRNHGRSPHSSAMNYPLMVADLLHFLDERNIEQCALVGHSMGGKVAMALALLRPERVAALVVVDICPIEYQDNRHDDVFAALQGMPLQSLEGRQQADTLLAQHIADAGMRQFLLSNLYRQRDAYAWRMNLPALVEHRGQLAAAPARGGVYCGPTLFVKGALSDYIDSRCSEAISSQFPQATLKIIADTGHWPHAEKPVVFNGLVKRFLQQHYSVNAVDHDEN